MRGIEDAVEAADVRLEEPLLIAQSDLSDKRSRREEMEETKERRFCVGVGGLLRILTLALFIVFLALRG